ncbi:MAG: DUF930 domain-containing protein [Devosia sp.]
MVIAALLAFPMTRQLSSPSQRVISVDLVSPPQAHSTVPLPDMQVPAAPGASLERFEPPIAAPRPVVSMRNANNPNDMIEAANLLASDILHDPANREIRAMLPRLDKYERITQLCSIEALEQVRLSGAVELADAVAPTAFGDTSIIEAVMKAPDGAYRAGRKWFEIGFECTVGDDLESVTAFKFHLGKPIPKDVWESHNLIAEDFDDD